MAGLVSLAALEGRWRLGRRILGADGSVAVMAGTTTFRRSGLRLVQEEAGELFLPGQGRPLVATRRYLWASEAGRIEVMFEDARPFHTVPLGVDRPETVYLCPPDRYAVAYDFSAFPAWRAVWQVEGPRKSYEMQSDYAPDTDPDPA